MFENRCVEIIEETIYCVLVEDEPLAIELMSNHISQRKELGLLAVVRDLDGLQELLANFKPSIIFLDLKIPSGDADPAELYRQISKDTSIVVVSAIPFSVYNSSLKLPVAYDLPKPVSRERFNGCIDEVLHQKYGT